MELLVVLIGLIVLGLAAQAWGVDSRDRLESAEWDRRRHWPGFSSGGRDARSWQMEFGIDILAARAEHQYRMLQAERRALVAEALTARPKGCLLRSLAQRVTVSWRWRPAPVRRPERV